MQPADDRRVQADLLFKRGLARRSLGRWEDALADWREALAIYEGLGEAEAAGRICVDIALQLAWGLRFEEALDFIRRGLIGLGERASPDRCRLLALSGLGLSMAGYYAAGDGMIGQALALAEQLGDQRLLGGALSAKAVHHGFSMQYRESVEAGLRAAQLLRSAGDLWSLADLLGFLQYSLGALGRFDEADGIGEELEPLAARLGNLGALIMAQRNRQGFFGLVRTESLDRFEEFCRSHLELCERAGGGLAWASSSHVYPGLLHFWRGRWQEALESFQKGAAAEDPGGVTVGWPSGFLFLHLAYAGDRDSAHAMLPQVRSNLPRAGEAKAWGAWAALPAVVEGLAVLGEREEASILYPLVLEALDAGALMRSYDGRLLQTVAGIAAAAGHQWERAEEHFQTALRQADELPSLIEQPDARRWYARMLIDRDAPGDRDKAFRLLTEAIEMYRKIGMPKHVEMAEALLAEL